MNIELILAIIGVLLGILGTVEKWRIFGFHLLRLRSTNVLRKLEEDRDQLQRLRKDPIEFGIFALSHTFYFLTLALLGWLVAGIQPEGPPLAAYAFGLAVISMAIGFVIGDTFGELHRLRHFERTINRIDMKIESHRRIIGDAAQYLER